MMRFCSRCLYSEIHPLGINFDKNNICTGCRVHEEKDNLDWAVRKNKLHSMLDCYRGRNYTKYDCVVPVSGGRDSFYIVHLVKNVYGLNPLLVTYNKHYNTKAGIYNISRLRTSFGCDIFTLTINPELVRRIMRASLSLKGSFHWHVLAGQTVLPIQMAVRMNIPLIVWGAHQGIEQVGMFSHLDEVEMTRRYRKEHDLMGLEAEDLVDYGGLTERELLPFFYPSDLQIRRTGVRGIYLGNYHRWDSKSQHESMVTIHHQYQGQLNRTFDTYNDVDDMYYTNMHDLIKVYKYGYGKVVDDSCREIRFGRLTRSEAINLILFHQKQPAINIEHLTKYIGMSFDEIISFSDPWRKIPLGSIDKSYYVDPDLRESREEPFKLFKKFNLFSPNDFIGDPLSEQLLTRGYASE